ncbi:MAG: YHS domain-containing protein [Acidobacteria bacterium]|nr:YHS domain-containing protein [Acidobacteriota bacterium]
MIRFFILRIILPLVLFLVLRSVITSLVRAFTQPSSTPQKAGGGSSAVRGGRELKRDPVCGTYVDSSISERVNGEMFHFCSQACRDKFRAS